MNKFQGQFLISRWNATQVRIGLTGGIASGKSSVGQFLHEEMSLPILDADVYSREAILTNSICRDAIINRYGKEIMEQDGKISQAIDRIKLGQIIFDDAKERSWLESLLHPIIIEKLVKEIKNHEQEQIIILIIPLLFEAKLTKLCHQIWVVNCTPKQQEERLVKRNNLTIMQAKKRIDAQINLKLKCKLADKVIDNTGSLNSWKQQTKELILNLQDRKIS